MYAVGYGRAQAARLLLEAGASGKARNSTGKNAAELVTSYPQNPLNQDEDLIYQLKQAAA